MTRTLTARYYESIIVVHLCRMNGIKLLAILTLFLSNKYLFNMGIYVDVSNVRIHTTHTHHSRFIPKKVAEASQIFL
jgi:hypothetical protein